MNTDNINLVELNCKCIPVEGLHNIKCPYCGESYYQELYATTTAVYYPPIYKNGVNINPDRNQSATTCRCLNCGKEFIY